MRRRRKVLHVFSWIFNDFPWTSTTFRVGYAAENPPEGPQMQGTLRTASAGVIQFTRPSIRF